jgi:hypothetical protein
VLRFTVSGVYSLNASTSVDSEALNVGTGNFPQLTIDCIDCSRPAPSRAEGRGLSQAPQVLSLLAFLALLVQKYKYCRPAPSRAESLGGLLQAPQVSTSFTSTKVQIMTPEALPDRAVADKPGWHVREDAHRYYGNLVLLVQKDLLYQYKSTNTDT